MQATQDQDTVTILMGVYNGADVLPEQLQSLADQDHRAWRLRVGDDGSTDESVLVLKAFAKRAGREVTIARGPQCGFAQNFLALIQQAPADTAWLALCDQDDVWLPHKLTRALAALRPLPPDTPAMYCARTWVTDAQLKNAALSPAFARPPSFGGALVQNIAPGNTIFLNQAAVRIVRSAAEAAREVAALPVHDWWLYQLVTGAGGTVVWDPEPALYYRQHSANLIGSNRGWAARARRLRRMLRGDARRWTDANLRALRAAAPHLTEANQALLRDFAEARDGGLWQRLRAPARLGLKRQSWAGQLALYLALALRRI